MRSGRNAFTLIEALAIIAIIAIIVGLLVVAVQRVRESAAFTDGQNRLRQIGIGTHDYAAQNGGWLPQSKLFWDLRLFDVMVTSDYKRTANVELLPFLGDDRLYRAVFVDGEDQDDFGPTSSTILFQNPLDPVRGRPGWGEFACNYVNNAQVFSVPHTLVGCTDGTSNTIFFTEHYRECNGYWFDLFDIHPRFLISSSTSLVLTTPTFADYGYSEHDSTEPPNADFYPITNGNPPQTTSDGGVTFQSQPSLSNCDPRMPNAASQRGLQVLMGDGSVRTVAPGVSPFVFWAAVTPTSGELDLPDF